jgi:hypothetical protein
MLLLVGIGMNGIMWMGLVIYGMYCVAMCVSVSCETFYIYCYNFILFIFLPWYFVEVRSVLSVLLEIVQLEDIVNVATRVILYDYAIIHEYYHAIIRSWNNSHHQKIASI